MANTINQLGGDFNKVAVCPSQPIAFSGHLSTHDRLAGIRNKPQ